MDNFRGSITALPWCAFFQGNIVEEFVGLTHPKSRKRALQQLSKQYAADAVNIFVKDPSTDAFIPAPGLAQTVANGNAWQKLLCSHAGQHDTVKKHFLTIAGKRETITLISFSGSIIFSINGGEVTQQQAIEISKVLPYLLEIFNHERQKQYSEIQLSTAEQSVTENKHIAHKLDATRRELHKALIKTRDEIEIIKRAHELEGHVDTLTIQRNDLIRLNEIKDEFISVASHQLRTPATVSKQYIGLLQEGYAGELTPSQLKYLKTAYDSNEALLTILNDLLKTAQLDSTQLVMQKKQVSFTHLINDVIKQLSTTIVSRDQEVQFKHPDTDISAKVNEDEIKLALTNVLENASKYTSYGKKILVHLTADDTHVSVLIKDEGVGIKEKNIVKIFEKFTRVDNELSDTVNGSGLGLYMVKRIIDLHDGNIEVDSIVGNGTSFTIRLPL